MPVTNATILIPDISGFTHFMSMMELEHGSHLISSFLETIIQNIDKEFEISEIEGDAVLLYKKGSIPSKQEVLDQCLKIFNAFHFQRKTMQQVVICPCGACQSLINLSLKFITHYGSILEIKVDRFVKASGLDMIIAHRILKNSVPSDEYILLTENFLKQTENTGDESGLSWQSSVDEFPFIGKINYEFAFLDNVRDQIPDPPVEEIQYTPDNTPFLEVEINAPFKDVYIALVDMSNRIHWMSRLKEVRQDDDHAYIGSNHICVFDNLLVKVSPIKMSLKTDEILYSETATADDLKISVVYEFRFRQINNGCNLACRILPNADKPLPADLYSFLFEGLKLSCHNLKAYAENSFQPVKSLGIEQL